MTLNLYFNICFMLLISIYIYFFSLYQTHSSLFPTSPIQFFFDLQDPLPQVPSTRKKNQEQERQNPYPTSRSNDDPFLHFPQKPHLSPCSSTHLSRPNSHVRSRGCICNENGFFFFLLLFSNYLLQIFWLVEVLSFFVRAYLVVN